MGDNMRPPEAAHNLALCSGWGIPEIIEGYSTACGDTTDDEEVVRRKHIRFKDSRF